MTNAASVPNPQFLVNRLLKNQAINIVIGASGVGKSIWITQQLHCMAYGDPFLGFATEPLPSTYYISFDRSQRAAEKLMAQSGLLDIPQFHFASWRTDLTNFAKKSSPEEALIDRLKHLESEFIIIEGLGFLVRDIIKQWKVALLFSVLDQFMTSRPEITILLSHHSAKTKEGNGYLNHREKALGSGAWAQGTDLYTYIEQAESKNEQSHETRIAHVLCNDFKDLAVPFFINEETVRLEAETFEKYQQRTNKSRASYFREQHERYSSR